MNQDPVVHVHQVRNAPSVSPVVDVLYAVVGNFDDGTEAVCYIREGGVAVELVGDAPAPLAAQARILTRATGRTLRLLRFDLAEVVETFEAPA